MFYLTGYKLILLGTPTHANYSTCMANYFNIRNKWNPGDVLIKQGSFTAVPCSVPQKSFVCK